MFCTKCGHELKDGSKFCIQCGAQIEVAAPSEGQTKIPKPQHEKESQGKGNGLIICILAALLVLGACGWLFLGGGLNKLKGSSANPDTANIEEPSNPNANEGEDPKEPENPPTQEPEETQAEKDARKFLESLFINDCGLEFYVINPQYNDSELPYIKNWSFDTLVEIYNNAIDKGYISGSKIVNKEIQDDEKGYLTSSEWQYVKKNLTDPGYYWVYDEAYIQAALDYVFGKNNMLIFDYCESVFINQFGIMLLPSAHMGYDPQLFKYEIRSIHENGDYVDAEIAMARLWISFDNSKYEILDLSSLTAVEEGSNSNRQGEDAFNSLDLSTVGTKTLRLYKDEQGYHIYTQPASTESVIGYARVLVGALNIRSDANKNSKSTGFAPMGKTYRVYEVKSAGGYTWYRVGSGLWIADEKEKWISYTAK